MAAVMEVGTGDQIQPRWFLYVADRLNVRLQAHVGDHCRRVRPYLFIFLVLNDNQNVLDHTLLFCVKT